jgi:hypothetical protein
MRSRRKRLVIGATGVVLVSVLGGVLLLHHTPEPVPEECADIRYVSTQHSARPASTLLKDIECDEYTKGGTCVEWEPYSTLPPEWTPYTMPYDVWGYNPAYPEYQGYVQPYTRARRPAPWLQGFPGGGGIGDRDRVVEKCTEVPEPSILLVLALSLLGLITVRWASK